MDIAFVLPDNNNIPIGGYKLVYQYANEFVDKGHDVTIYFRNLPVRIAKNKLDDLLFVGKVLKRTMLSKRKYRRVSWYQIRPEVNLKYNVWNSKQVGKHDVIIATAVTTADFVANLSNKAGRKFYFIQNYEAWNGVTNEQVDETYKLPLEKIVIAEWLKEKVQHVNPTEQVTVIPNFLDQNEYFHSKSVEDRSNIIALLNHTQPSKRTKFGLEVLEQVKKRVPDMRVYLYGAYEKPKGLPEYVTYFEKPSVSTMRDKIHGESKVYLLPSILEGWGLTGMEAMSNGSVPVASDLGGMRDFMTSGINAVLVDPNDMDGFVDAITDLLTNESERLSMAESAVKTGETFTIERSVAMFISAIK